jgi:hypothetical protein
MLTSFHILSAKLALTSPTSGGRSAGIVRSRTKATEFVLRVVLYQVKSRLDGPYLPNCTASDRAA